MGNMQIHKGIETLSFTKKTIVTIGIFDGVHLAHQKLLSYLHSQAQDRNLESVLLTFSPHPRTVLAHQSPVQMLTTDSEKTQLIEKQHIDHIVIIPFTKGFSEISALDFLKEILVQKINAQEIVLGYDHHFGKNREGNINLLQQNQAQYGFEVSEIPIQIIHNVPINSSNIRKLIIGGEIGLANKLLGRKYSFSGVVSEGKKLGRTIGFPTANIVPTHELKLVPANGVYAVETHISGKKYLGMMNIGYRPTVDGKTRTIEVHIFNFNSEIYGTVVEIFPIQKLRDEQKFDSIDDLIKQLHQDKTKALEFLN
jgi:riboflavin kinase/FMN adenylyltransferase